MTLERDPLEIYNDEAVRERLQSAVAEYMQASPDEAPHLADAILEHGILNPAGFYTSNDLQSLERVNAALAKLEIALDPESMTHKARDLIQKLLTFGPYYSGVLSGEINRSAEKNHFYEYIETQGGPLAEALSLLEENVRTVRGAISEAIEEIQKSPEKKRKDINMYGISLVDAVRFVWHMHLAKVAPERDLNEATQFSYLLQEVLDCCGVDGTARSNFQAWVKAYTKSP